MLTAFISHQDCEQHNMGPEHPESPLRLVAIKRQLERSGLAQQLDHHSAVPALAEQILLAHSRYHMEKLAFQLPEQGIVWTDDDTALCPHSLRAASLAVGSVILATNRVLNSKANNAFCAVRPPGHHAEHELPMGFCLYNNVAIGALHALQQPGIERVAIFDFDVHHGNGTVDIFKDRPEVMVCSTFQHPFYPDRYSYLERPNIINCPLPAFSDGYAFRKVVEQRCLPALQAHKPDIIFISAGFDAHAEDPMADLRLHEDDYRWVTQLLLSVANQYANGRLVSVLEGGYNPDALARSVEAHLQVLAGF
ncbi:histone deacetylase family protein [Balneatrix alpica]|uniref:Histone deacetylase family protein n=1 Tax=Balneatrix alpica TaxID=75684 RepID=A0ABV5ZEI2_9GAMM|nr:histone deacetylase family protein [Balneatrix alpica]